MSFWTLKQIRDKVEVDLDLKEETFITRVELNAYINEAIREAEAEIHTLYEDYFLTNGVIPIISGTSEYKLPSDIYAWKIRGLIYDDGGSFYKIKRVKDLSKIPFFRNASDNWYEFLLINKANQGMKLKLYPTPQQSNSTALTCWYIRNAKVLSVDTDVCDIVEFVNFVLAHTKYSCMKKEGNPLLSEASMALEQQRKLMVETLTARVIDEDNKIELDVSTYEEMS